MLEVEVDLDRVSINLLSPLPNQVISCALFHG
jgi:hypothetical protein